MDGFVEGWIGGWITPLARSGFGGSAFLVKVDFDATFVEKIDILEESKPFRELFWRK